MDEDYTVELKGDTSQYSQSMGSAVGTTDALTSSLGKLGASIASLQQRTQHKIDLFVGGMAASIAGVTISAARLEQQMSQLTARSVMAGNSTRAYSSTVTGLRREFGMTSNDVIQLVTQLNRLGVPLSQQQGVLSSYAHLAATTGESIQGLTEAQTTFMRQMGNTSTFQQVDRYSSMVSGLANNFGASAQSTLDFANSIAPLSKSMGMSAQQIAGVSAAFSKAGADGFGAVNVYTQMLTDINRSIQYGSPRLQSYSDILGVTVDQIKQMGSADIMSGLFDALNRQGPQAVKTLEQLGYEGVRTQRNIAAVMAGGGLSGGIAAAQQGYSDTSGFEKGYKQALGGLNDQLGKISETMKVFAQSAGQIFLPAADSMAKAVNFLITPLRAVSDLFAGDSSVSTWARGIAGAAVGVVTLLSLLPRLWTLASAGGLAVQAFRSPLALGFRQGFNPERMGLIGRNRGVAGAAPLLEGMESYMAGQGSWGRRTLYRTGQRIGDVFNPLGRRGLLENQEFLDPEGNPIHIQSGVQNMLRAMRIDPEAQEAIMKAYGQVGKGARAGLSGGIGLAGTFVRAGLTPLTQQYYQNSVAGPSPLWRMTGGRFGTYGFKDDITQAGSFSNTAAGRLISREGFDANLEAYKLQKQHNAEMKESVGVWKTFRSEFGATARTAAAAGVGAGVGAVRLGARGVAGAAYGLAGGVVNTLGGPIMLGIMGAGALGTVAYREHQTQIALRKGDDTDQSAGAAYRDALGIAATATKNFAQIMQDSGTATKSGAVDMATALKVSSDDINTASFQTSKIVDQNIKSMTTAQATVYASNILPSATAPEAQALKMDLVARFGGTQAQGILNSAQGPPGNLFNLITPDQQNFNLFGQTWLGMTNRVTTSAATQGSVNMAADTAKNQVALASQRGGAYSGGRAAQSIINQNVAALMRGAKGGGAFGGNLSSLNMTDPTTKGQIDSLMQSMGITDDASRQAYINAVNAAIKANPQPGAAQDKAIQDALTGNLAGTTIGARLAEYRGAGGIYTGQAYVGTSLPGETVENQLGAPTIARLRGGSAGGAYALAGKYTAGQVATQMGPGGAGVQVQQALLFPEDAAKQFRATESVVGDTLDKFGGNLDKTVGSLQTMVSQIDDVNSAMGQQAAAYLTEAQRQQGVANVIGGRTTLTDQINTGMAGFNTALANLRTNVDSGQGNVDFQKQQQNIDSLREAATQRMVALAQQFRSMSIQRTFGQEALTRGQGIQRGNVARQTGYQVEDFAIQRQRAEEQFGLQQSRAVSDYYRQRGRAEADFTRQRRRDEVEYNHQVQVMAADSAKTIYDIYSRIQVQRVYDAPNLLQNLNEQQKALQTQQADLARARRLGLSNAAIQMMGLNEAGGAQQLSKLVQDLASDPALIAQYNKAVKQRTGTAGALMKDPSNEQWTEMTRSRRINLKNQQEDFDRSMGQQHDDFVRSMGRSRKDFATQEGFQQADFTKMQARQQKEMEIGFAQQQADFNYQSDQAVKQAGELSRDIGMSMDEAYKLVMANTSGDVKKEFDNLKKLFDQMTVMSQTKATDLYTAINVPFSQLSAYAPFAEATGGANNSTQAGAHGPGGSHAAVGGPNDGSGSANTYAHVGDTAGTSQKRYWPVANHHVGTPWGARGSWKGSKTLGPGYHSGADFPVPSGTQVHAAEDGTVSSAGWNGAYGNMIDINHGGGVHTWYAHNSGLRVSRGDQVNGGDMISLSGDTGRTTGPHVHLELRTNGFDHDPIPWLKGASTAGDNKANANTQGGGGVNEPDWSKMSSVKNWDAWMHDLGVDGKGRLGGGQVLDHMIHNAWAKAVKASGSSGTAYSGHSPFLGTPSTIGAGGARAIWNLLITGGLTEQQAAGVMGNMQYESGMRWNVVQGGGSSSNPSSTSQGYGLVQWTPGSKLSGILHAMGLSNSPENQVRALLHQLSGKGPDGEGRAGSMLHAARTVVQATTAFLRGYERAKDTSGGAASRRDRFSEQFFNQFKKAATGNPSAGPGWHMVGENGYEFIKLKGGEEIRNHAQSRVMVGGGEVITPNPTTVNNNHYDSSTSFAGAEITVQTSDVNGFLREIEAKKRLASLTRPKASV